MSTNELLTTEELNELKELIEKHEIYKIQESGAKKVKDDIREKINTILQKNQITEIDVFIDSLDKEFECKYVDRKIKSVDYVILNEIVGSDDYNNIVTENISTSLRVAAKAKPKTKTSKPESKTINGSVPGIPKGKFII